VNEVVLLLITVCGVFGFIEPPNPAEGVTVHCCMVAEQLAVVPPFDPAQLHVHGPLPFTALAVPVLHKLVAGADVRV